MKQAPQIPFVLAHPDRQVPHELVPLQTEQLSPHVAHAAVPSEYWPAGQDTQELPERV